MGNHPIKGVANHLATSNSSRLLTQKMRKEWLLKKKTLRGGCYPKQVMGLPTTLASKKRKKKIEGFK
jgi:hypothetical protein